MFRILTAVVLIVLTIYPAGASRITGKVTDVLDSGVIITVADESTPIAGDKVKLFFQTSTGATMEVGIWRVVSVEGGKVEAEFVSGANRPRKGMRAIVTAADPDSYAASDPEFSRALEDSGPANARQKTSGIEAALIFDEDFNENKNGWKLGQLTSHEAVIQNGKLYIRPLNSGTSFIANDAGIGWNDSFAIQTHIKKRSGGNTHFFGLLFGYNEASAHAYCFGMNGEGYAGLFFLNQGQWEKPIIGGNVGSLQKGNSENTLAVIRNAGATYFFINGKSLGSKDNLNLFGNQVGFSIDHDIELAVDNLRVWNDIPRHLIGPFLAAAAVDKGTVQPISMKIIPYALPAGEELAFTFTYLVTDPEKENSVVPVKIFYSVSKGPMPGNRQVDPDKIVLEDMVSQKITEGQSQTYSRKNLHLPVSPGTHTLTIGIGYQGFRKSLRQEFTVTGSGS